MTETTFQSSADTETKTLVITVAGELDAAVAPRLDGEIRAGIFTSEPTRLVLDLTDVGFMDSTALGSIIAAKNLMRERDGVVVVRRPSPAVARLLEVTMLAGEVEIVT